MIPVLFGVAFLVFTILSLTPGDPGTIILGITAKPEDVAALNAQFGYDKSFLIRFFSYIGNIIFHFDLGTSYASRQPVINDILARFPNTFILALLSMCVSSIIGISLGILSAVRQYSITDHVCVVVALVFASMPGFWLGLMLLIVFSLKLGWFPSFGAASLKHFILPTLTVSLTSAAGLLRLTRSAMLETIRQEYIRTAKAKGCFQQTCDLETCAEKRTSSGCNSIGNWILVHLWVVRSLRRPFLQCLEWDFDDNCDPPERYSDGYGSNFIPGSAFSALSSCL